MARSSWYNCYSSKRPAYRARAAARSRTPRVEVYIAFFVVDSDGDKLLENTR